MYQDERVLKRIDIGQITDDHSQQTIKHNRDDQSATGGSAIARWIIEKKRNKYRPNLCLIAAPDIKHMDASEHRRFTTA